MRRPPSVSCAMTTEMPIELATLRISVSIEVPSVRSWLGSVRNGTVLNGTNTRPKPKPCRIETVTISGAAVRQQHARGDDGITDHVLQIGRRQRHGRIQHEPHHRHEHAAGNEILVLEDRKLD